MTDLFDALGLEQTITHEGKTYRLAPVRQVEVVAAWEEWLGDQAIEFFERRRHKLGIDGLDRAYKAVASQAAEGAFDYLGPISMAKLGTLDGKKKMAFFRARASNPNVDEHEISAIVEKEIDKLLTLMARETAVDEVRAKNDEGPGLTTGANQDDSTGSSASLNSSEIQTGDSIPSESAS